MNNDGKYCDSSEGLDFGCRRIYLLYINYISFIIKHAFRLMDVMEELSERALRLPDVVELAEQAQRCNKRIPHASSDIV